MRQGFAQLGYLVRRVGPNLYSQRTLRYSMIQDWRCQIFCGAMRPAETYKSSLGKDECIKRIVLPSRIQFLQAGVTVAR